MNGDRDEHDLIDKLATADEEELTIEELRSRWKFQSPFASAYLLALIIFLGGLALRFGPNGSTSDHYTGLWMVVSSIIMTTITKISVELVVRRKTRAQLLGDIHAWQEIHREDPPV